MSEHNTIQIIWYDKMVSFLAGANKNCSTRYNIILEIVIQQENNLSVAAYRRDLANTWIKIASKKCTLAHSQNQT